MKSWQSYVKTGKLCIEYKFSKLSGKTVLVVDGDAFTVKGKPFGIGVARREPVIVGMCQGVLTVLKNGRAELYVNDANEIIKVK